MRGTWAGYIAAHDEFRSVTATWTQPEVLSDPNGRLASTVFWVGLDGYGSSTAEQIGTEGIANAGGGSRYRAWADIAPNPMVTLDMVVRPGDKMTAEVSTDRRGHFVLSLRNSTTGVSVRRTVTVRDAKAVSAEIVVEPPPPTSLLASFPTVIFTECAINGRPISSFHWLRTDLGFADGRPDIPPSALSPNGTSFSVSATQVAHR